jgi:hypothetical protein
VLGRGAKKFKDYGQIFRSCAVRANLFKPARSTGHKTTYCGMVRDMESGMGKENGELGLLGTGPGGRSSAIMQPSCLSIMGQARTSSIK